MNKDTIVNTASVVVTCTLLAAGVVGGLYWAACQLSLQTLRALAVGLVLALPVVSLVTWRLATNAAREHLKGFERGLDGAGKTIGVVGQGLSATARVVRASAQPQYQTDNSDLLPRVPMRMIEARHSGELEAL